MKNKLFKFLSLAVVGVLVAGVVRASLAEYWITTQDIIPRTDISVDIGSPLKRVSSFFASSTRSNILNVSATSTLATTTITHLHANDAVFIDTYASTSIVNDLTVMNTFLLGGNIGTGGIDFENQPGYNASYLQGGYLLATSTTDLSQIMGGLAVFGTTTASSSLIVDSTTLYVDAYENKVGIGTASPAVKLDLYTGASSQGLRIRGADPVNEIADFYITSQGALIMDMTAGSDGYQYIDFRPENSDYGLIVRETDGSGTAAFLNMNVVEGALDYANFVVTAANTTSGLVLQEGGNVGIGTTSPEGSLHVYNSASATIVVDALTAGNSQVRWNKDGVYKFGILMPNAVTDRLGVYDTSSNEIVTFKDGGNVGIGTTSPATTLDVYGTSTLQNVIPASTMTYDLGSAGKYWRQAYIASTTVALLTTSDLSVTGTSTLIGRVMIGTSSPSYSPLYQLHIGGDASLYDASLIDKSVGIFANDGTTLGNGFIFDTGTTAWGNRALKFTMNSTQASLQIYSGDGVASPDGILGLQPSAGKVGVGTISPTGIFEVATSSSASSSYFSVGQSGNVGIGTTGPISKLSLGDVNTANYTNRIALNEESDGTYFYGISYMGNPYGLGLHAGHLNLSAPDLFIQATTGNVGIGTTSPKALLDVLRSSDTEIASFEGDAGERVVIDKDGNVGIGTSTPRSILDIEKTTATTTITIGDDTITPACLKLGDADGGGWTYCKAIDGALTCSTAPCDGN